MKDLGGFILVLIFVVWLLGGINVRSSERGFSVDIFGDSLLKLERKNENQ